MKKSRTLLATVAAGLTIPTGASAANSPNPNFAGYQFNNYVAVPATVSALIVVPKLKCTSGPERDIWPGVGIQSVSSFAGLDIFCKNGKAHYFAYIEVQSKAKVFAADAAKPGDKVTFKVYESTAHVIGSAVDQTHAFTATKTGAGSGTGNGVQVGDRPVYLGAGKLGVPNFGSITFTKALANGATSTPGPFGSLSPTAYNMFTTSSSSPLQVQTNPFTSNKESFKTVFKHS
ncbi:MAG TPA: G1 family glutamic endopeptidase [Solirubrobacteraceae bacterium]|nr:G1 family glutamic endopeptidase [Solirubrobacteraceae bacterium]